MPDGTELGKAQVAEEAIERLTATSLAHPSAAAATSTKRQDDTRISSRHTFFADPREGVGYIWAKHMLRSCKSVGQGRGKGGSVCSERTSLASLSPNWFT